MPTLSRKRKRRDKAQRRSIKFLGIFGTIVGTFLFMVFVGLSMAAFWLTDLPDYSNIDLYAKSAYTTIYASDNQTILAKLALENRIETAINKVSPYVLEGTVATEDERFYEHQGVDLQGIIRAVFVNASAGGTSEGASTITQQLVRNTVLLDEMNDISIKRKIREMYIACKIEEQYTKDQILMMYLNVVNYGDGCYGIEAASEDYFGCTADQLTLSQAALLIGIPQSPTANDPRLNYDKSIKRRATVLARMLSNGCITQAQYEEALNDRPELVKKGSADDKVSNIAPYFVDYVKQQLASSNEFSASELSEGGLTVYTTLDVKCQKAAVKAIKENMQYQGSMDASLTSIDPDTGNIVAMVGGRDYDKNQFNLATQMSRQAGSSFKTFTLLAALKAGVSPYTEIDSSSPASISSTWTVRNSEGEGGGNMSIRTATTNSVNTVFARLVHVLGPTKVVDMAQTCGITSTLQAYDSIALGTQGVNTLEMADAYATIANGGVHHDPAAITQVLNSRGETVYTRTVDEGTRAFSAAIAQVATDILETVVTSGTGTAAQLYNGQVSAGKTGTSEEGRDLWFCGFTPQYSTAVWCGYRTERATGQYGGTVAAPIWHDYMTAALDGVPNEEFPTTDETITYKDNWTFPTASYEYGASRSKDSSGTSGKTKDADTTGKTDTTKDSGTTDSSTDNGTGSPTDTSGGNSSGNKGTG